jgi:hypothetical protein
VVLIGNLETERCRERYRRRWNPPSNEDENVVYTLVLLKRNETQATMAINGNTVFDRLINGRINAERWWNDTDRRKPK